MEDMQNIDVALSPVLTALQAPGTPQALQAPTRQVSGGFMFALTAAAISLYILYIAATVFVLLAIFTVSRSRPYANDTDHPAPLRDSGSWTK